jgi:UDP-N-acetylmuramoyl-tripeptide--D-alanyl-D-alanine ligase
MRELGESSAVAHAEIATLASQLGVDHLIAINAPEYGNGIDANSSMTLHQCATKADALKVAGFINRGDVVLCKASRSDMLEEVVEGIEMQWKSKIDRDGEIAE